MKQEKFENIFSKERVSKYYKFYSNDVDKAMSLYVNNIKLSESLYPLLSITEISIRNSINRTMCNYYHSADWFEFLKEVPELYIDIESARNNLIRRKEIINNGKITAELTFGFWTKLFNSKYENSL